MERGRHPELAELLGCTYIGVEVLEKHEARTEVHAEPTLASGLPRRARRSPRRGRRRQDGHPIGRRSGPTCASGTSSRARWRGSRGAPPSSPTPSRRQWRRRSNSQRPRRRSRPRRPLGCGGRLSSSNQVKAEQDHATLKKRKGAVVAVQQQAAASSPRLHAARGELRLPHRPPVALRGEIDIKWNLGLSTRRRRRGGGEAEEEEQQEETGGQRRWR